MKKLIFALLAAVALFLAPGMLMAQATVGNETGRTIIIKSVAGDQLVVNSHSKGRANFVPSAGQFTFDLYVYSPGRETLIGSFTKEVISSFVEITEQNVIGIRDPQKQVTRSESKVVENLPQQTKQIIQEPLVKKNLPTTTLVVKNLSVYRIACLSGVFEGLALAPNQTSDLQYTVNTGQIDIIFKHDCDSDKKAVGKSYRQSVYSGIITSGQKELIIRNENLGTTSGAEMKTYVKSLIPFKISFISGPWVGNALSQNDVSSRQKVNQGFNSMSIQYVGSDGLKYQANIEVILTKHDVPLLFRESDIKNARAIKQ